MLLWIMMAVLTAAALAAVLWPLMAGSRTTQRRVDHDVAVYQAQLKEIDADLERGQINSEDAELARAEIGRRLIQVAEVGTVSTAGATASEGPFARIVAVAVLILVPATAVGLYLAVGAPSQSDQPLAARLQKDAPANRVDVLIAQVEMRLRQVPDDGEGWELIAPVYFKVGRYTDASDAYLRANRLLGESPERLEGLGESLAMANNGMVDARARQVFESALTLDRLRVKPRLWLALAKEQEGKNDAALADYRDLQKSLNGPSALAGVVAGRIAELEAKSGGGAVGKGPSAADVEAAGSLTDDQRKAMIEGMVSQLAERLKTDGKDLDGWMRLTRSYVVLGNKVQAMASLAAARQNFSGEPDALKQLDELATELRL